MTTNMTTKSAPALGVEAWFEKVRELAPEARIPFVAVVMASAFERGLTPEAFVAALPELPTHKNWNWVAKHSLQPFS